MIIYNLFPPLAGNVRDWKPHLVRAADMGFDWIFVNPIQLPGYSGSLYSIKDYFRLNPILVDGSSPAESVSAFKRMAQEAQALGLKLMVDLVVSHCAFDSALITEHPGWFRKENGRIAHPFCVENQKKVVWKDLAQFDHKHAQDKEGLFQYLFRVVQFLADLGIEGFRCDAAYQVPTSFWRRVISETRHKHPGAVFLAETLGCSPADTVQTATAGFEYIFNSSKWWDFFSPWLLEQYNLTREETQSISFPESHDTPRLAESLQGNVDGLKQRYLFSALFSAGVMMPIGFEFAFRKKLHVVKTRPKDWEQPETDLSGFIKRVNQAKSQNPIFKEDAPTEMLPADNPNILFLWKGSLRARQEALIILNKDIHNKQHFFTDNLYQYVQNQSPLTDVSPDFPLEYLPTPYEYNLRPGQGIILVTDHAG
ncbi:MAG: alpha-amylase [Verrucomicrobia bacterium]|nr:MAG: alpha-amylase [Verrucomicrobiota bacterium]